MILRHTFRYIVSNRWNKVTQYVVFSDFVHAYLYKWINHSDCNYLSDQKPDFVMHSLQAPYLLYVEVLEVENVYSSHVPSKRLENTLRFTKSEEDLTTCYVRSNGSPHPEFSLYGGSEFDDAECWSQEDDEILQVRVQEIEK